MEIFTFDYIFSVEIINKNTFLQDVIRTCICHATYIVACNGFSHS